MPFTYIVDTNPAVQSDADTFGTFAEVFSHIQTTHGSALNSGGDAGLVSVFFRNSSGVPLKEEISINSFTPNGSPNRLEIVGQMSNGYPAVLEDVDDGGSVGYVLQIYDDNVDVYAEEEDSFIIRGNTANTTTGKSILGVSKPMDKLEGLVLDGLGSSYYGGISGTGTAIAKNLKILRCNRQFYGAIRNGNVSLDHCTINSCRLIRSAGSITNSIVTNITSYTEGDGFVAGTDYNAYDVDKTSLKYNSAITDTSTVDVNSIFNLDVEANLVDDPVGGYNLTAGSILTGAASDGTNIGAFATGLVGNPPVISIGITGDTLTATVSDDTTINPSLQLYINGVATGAPQTSVNWDLSGYGLAQGVYRITVQATDDDANVAASNEKYYSVGNVLKILWIGNSLTQVPVEPDNAQEDVIQMVEAMFAADGGQVFIDRALLGGASFIEHNANQPTHDAIATGNYDIVLSQYEDDPGTGYSDYQTYLNTEMSPLMDGATSVGSDWVVWSHQPNVTYDEDRYNLGQTNMANSLTWFPEMQLINNMKAWHDVLVADPSLDLYADNIHQNSAGAYVSALSIYRFLTGADVTNQAYEPAELQTALGTDGLGFSAADTQLLRTTTNTVIDNQFVRSSANSCVVTMTSPAGAITVTEGDSVTFTATAIDSSTGDLSANIIWRDDEGTVLHTGNTFTTTTLPTGKLLITASCTGSDNKVSTAARSVTVRTVTNAAPVTIDGSRTVDFNASFTQVNLSSLMSDDNDEIDLNTLTITSQPANGVATQDGQTLSTINLDYSGTDFVGSDSFTYTVADLDGLVSNESTVYITVNPANPPSGAVAGNTVTRGQMATLVMSDYTSTGGSNMVEVFIVDTGDGTEYECVVTANTDSQIDITIPGSDVITTTLSNATIKVRPIVSL